MVEWSDVWLNGQQIANSQQMFGTFRQFEFDVTKQISQKNELTVEVFRAQPGDPNTGFADWNPRPADESMGIFREVSVKTCGPVSLTHSAVRSRVNTKTLDEAWLTIATELTNHSDKAVSGKVKGTAMGTHSNVRSHWLLVRNVLFLCRKKSMWSILVCGGAIRWVNQNAATFISSLWKMVRCRIQKMSVSASVRSAAI